jgi:NDP-sugar pyrophosphorylase family protein
MESVEGIQGIVLAGTYHWAETSLEALRPRPLLPVAQTPLIGYALRWLRDGGITQATICANSAARVVRDCLQDGSGLGLRLQYHEDWTPRGAAGCARDAALRGGVETFVVTDGTAIPTADLQEILAAHRAARAAMTVVVHEDPSPLPGERPLSPAGVYVVERRSLEHVPARGFQDLKEGLIPRLHRAGERVVTHVAQGPCPRILNFETYLAVNEWMVERLARRALPPEGYHANGEILAHSTARVHPAARLVGPVVLGPAVTVGRGATIVGPVTIGGGGTVEADAVLCRSVTWGRSLVGAGALVDRSVLADDAAVEPGARVFGALRAAPARGGAFARLFAGRAASPRPAFEWTLGPEPLAAASRAALGLSMGARGILADESDIRFAVVAVILPGQPAPSMPLALPRT